MAILKTGGGLYVVHNNEVNIDVTFIYAVVCTFTAVGFIRAMYSKQTFPRVSFNDKKTSLITSIDLKQNIAHHCG